MLWWHQRRSATRLAIVQVLYQIEILDDPCEKVISEFVEFRAGAIGFDEKPYHTDNEVLADIVRNVTRDCSALDSHIAGVLSDEWSMHRLGATMRALLRAACYELVSCSDVPVKVVIKEYVDIARGFHDLEETGFVNAALDRLARVLRTQEMKSDRSNEEPEVDAALSR